MWQGFGWEKSGKQLGRAVSDGKVEKEAEDNGFLTAHSLNIKIQLNAVRGEGQRRELLEA